jgi:hypothetical protein
MFASLLAYATRPPEPVVPLRPSRRTRRAAAAVAAADLTIRLAGDDERALDDLAALDGRVLGAGPRLVAEIGGTPIAALALGDATAVADPMRPSAPFVELLRVRARQLA